MTGTHGADGDPARLRDLLEVTDRDPRELVEEIRVRREAVQDDRPFVAEVLRAEYRYLEKEASAPGAALEVRMAVERSAVALLDLDGRSLTAAEDRAVAAVFDLAEVKAAYLARGMTAEAERIEEDLQRRIAVIEVDDHLVEEARERYAVLSTEGEELPLRHKVLMLGETHRVIDALADRSAHKVLRRMSRRLKSATDDHRLAERLERVLGVRGARWFEVLSLALLVALFVLIGIEITVPLSDAWLRTLLWVDGLICGYFVLEFLFKLALAPSRRSWFLRHALTDLLPALPVVFLFPGVPPGLENVSHETFWIRALRFLRIAYFARYINAIRPLLHVIRLILFLIRGLDSLVRRFSPLLNRNFVFFEGGSSWRLRPRAEGADVRDRVFRALRREHVLLAELQRAERTPLHVERAHRLADQLGRQGTFVRDARPRLALGREVAIEEALDNLYNVTPDALGMLLPRQDILALDRVVRVINAPVIRSLPFLRRLRSDPVADSPHGRVVDFGRQIARRLDVWRERILFFADLHGILTGPQILDRIATTVVNASKRPAVRLLLFGGLFLIVRLLVGEDSAVGVFLKRFVATPLLVLGGFCLVLLLLGRWMKRLAGEAAETLKRTSEASFIGLLELLKSRQQTGDVEFLARRIFRNDLSRELGAVMLGAQIARVRDGRMSDGQRAPTELREDVTRAALLYLHFLDGAILHDSDVKTSQQLLANLSLENIRLEHLDYSRRDHKRLRRLSLDEIGGFGLTGPLLWFRCITESVALECAKRVMDYNRHCVPLSRRRTADPDQIAAMERWLAAQRAEAPGRRIERRPQAAGASHYVTTEFNALDFLTDDPDRESHIERVFGRDMLEVLRLDRQRLIREIFGTRPLARLPRSRRTINFYAIYTRHLSRGRALLLPLLWLYMLAKFARYGVSYTVGVVREILAPESARSKRQSGRASFGVALRKIHRMKAPGLLEAMYMRTCFDPEYVGQPATWSQGERREENSELERDMSFLMMLEHERLELRELAETVRRRVESCHHLLREAGGFGEFDAGLRRRLGERAVTVSFVTDRGGLRTMLEAREWAEAALIRMEAVETRLPARRLQAVVQWLARGLRRHPADRWLSERMHERAVSRRGRRNFRRAYRGDAAARRFIDMWYALPADSDPAEAGLTLARRFYADPGEVRRELSALRAVQSLSVLDVRNYRRLVFRLGGYAADGERPELADALP